MLTCFRWWRKLRGGRWLKIDMDHYGSYSSDEWIRVKGICDTVKFNNRILDEERY